MAAADSNYASAPPPQIAPPVDENGRLGVDVNCRSCGYNLRGLSTHIACPECSTPVEMSVRGDRLMFSDPVWVERLGRGTMLIIAGLIGQTVLGTGFGICFGVSMASNPAGVQMEVMVAIGAAIGFLGALVIVIGTWVLTTPDPALGERSGGMSTRLMARYAILLTLIAAPLQAAAGGWNTGFNMTPGAAIPSSIFIAGIAGMIAGAAGIAAYACIGLHLRALAKRIPKPSLASQMLVVTIGYAATQILGTVVGFGTMVALRGGMMAGGAGGPAFDGWFALVIVGGCLTGLGGIVFGIWGLVLLFLYNSAFRQTAAIARQLWSRGRPTILPDQGAARATM